MLLHISWGVAKKTLGPHDLAQGFPVIKRENLLYDLADAHIFTKGELNCPIPESLKDRCGTLQVPNCCRDVSMDDSDNDSTRSSNNRFTVQD